MNMITINEKEAINLRRVKRVYERIWREERKGDIF